MKAKITENEKKVYEHIKRCLQEGYPPTVREICAACGFKSTSTAHRAIRSLVDKGYLEKQDNLNRAIKLAGRRAVKVPIVSEWGELGADMTDRTDSYINYDPQSEQVGRLFAVRASKDIAQLYIKAGDIAVAELGADTENDAAAAVRENGGDTLGISLTDGEDEDNIVGKILAVIRYL